MSRVTALAVSLLSFGAQDLIGSWKTYNHNFDITKADGKSSSNRYEKNQPVKRKRAFSITVFANKDVTYRATNLDLTVWSIAGTSRIGDIKSATITVTTKTAEGSGAVEFDMFPVATGTALEIQASEFVSSEADLVMLGSQSDTITDFYVNVLFTVGGLAFAAPMMLSAGSHKVEAEQIQMQDVTLSLHGAITAPVSSGASGSNLLFALIATGSAALVYSVNTGATTEVGNALITRATLTYQDAAIVEHQFEFQGQSLATAE